MTPLRRRFGVGHTISLFALSEHCSKIKFLPWSPCESESEAIGIDDFESVREWVLVRNPVEGLGFAVLTCCFRCRP
jgi:hypothetical protein